jgi:cobalt-zinc-cadmium efflux system protein
MSSKHSHNHDEAPFGLGLVLNSTFTVFEFVVGITTGSLALIADATHNLTDSLTLVISYIAQRIGKKLPTKAKTYGYGRATIVAALLNAGILIAVAAFIAYEAIKRFSEPHEVSGGVVASVAFVGILINGYIAWRFSKRKHDLNARSAYTNMLYDTLSSVGALIAGLVMVITGWSGLDAIIGLLISGMLLFATFKIIAEAIHVLLEGVPPGTDLVAIQSELCKVRQVKDVDDLHVWAISSEYSALSCHLIIDEADLKDSRHIVEAAKQMLKDKFDINHSTIEVELEDCIEHSEHEQITAH